MPPTPFLLAAFPLIKMRGDYVSEWSKEQSRKGLFSQANTSTSKGQSISIMPFQSAESQTHLSQDGWCLLSGNRKVFVHLFVFPHAAPNNISLTPPSHNLCFRMCLSLCIHHPFNARFSCWKSFQARMQNDFKVWLKWSISGWQLAAL